MASAAAAAEEGEDPRRRRSDTDCVFFLVSRVSCTKVPVLPRKTLAQIRRILGFPRRVFAGEWYYVLPPLIDLLIVARVGFWSQGSKCEYRHCEAARFNPRNCWYWFHGNCVNPSCTFRHPVRNPYFRTHCVQYHL
jgi:hypothetical protein